MATIRERVLKKGEKVFDIQVKIKNPRNGKFEIKTTTWKPDPKMSIKQQERECDLFARKYEEEVAHLYENSTDDVLDYDITFAECAEMWLERIKRDFSLNYYELNVHSVNWINRYLGVFDFLRTK